MTAIIVNNGWYVLDNNDPPGAGGNAVQDNFVQLAAILNATNIGTGTISLGAYNYTIGAGQTIDGRDLSVDGAKLDGIEALADVTDATNVAAAGAAMAGGAFHDGFSDFVADEHFLQTAITNISGGLPTGLVTVTSPMGTLGSTTNSSANWNTAFGWGNHASAGYAVAGGAYHDGFSDFAANEHIDWTSTASSLSTTGAGAFNTLALGGAAIGDDGFAQTFSPVNDNAAHAYVVSNNPEATITGTYNNKTLGFVTIPKTSLGVTNSGYAAVILGTMLTDATHAGTLAATYGFHIDLGHYTGTTGTTNSVTGLSVAAYRRGGAIGELTLIKLAVGSGTGGTVTTPLDMKTLTGWNWAFESDNQKLLLGAGQDAAIYYDGTDLHIDPQEVGAGHVVLNSVKTTTGDPAGVEGKLYWNTVDNAIKMYADGAWRTLASW